MISNTEINCCACSACKNICPNGAITLQENVKGFLVPQVSDACIDCGLCEKVCPSLKEYKPRSDPKTVVFAVKNKNDDVRFHSASGAFFPSIAKHFISLGGYVAGCIMKDGHVEHLLTNNYSDISLMQDSKYVQSDVKDIFEEIAIKLKEGNYVLFSGTSCHVAGLLSYLNLKKINRDKLLTIDFFCHGVPSPRLWAEYLKLYFDKRGSKPTNYRFRCKKYGWGKRSRGTFLLSTAYYEKNHKLKADNFTLESKLWGRIFSSNLALREYCFTCPYTSTEKPADITMGDFWGIEDFYPQFDDGKGTSVIIVRSEFANEIVNELNDLEMLNATIEQAINKQLNAKRPCTRPRRYDEFWNFYKTNGFENTMGKFFQYTMKGKIKYFIKRVMFSLHLIDIS